MKKLIVGLSIVAILAVVIVLFTNSRISGPESKKAATEMSKDCGKCASSATCPEAKSKDNSSEKTETAVATTDVEKEKPCCKEAGSMKKGCEETACPMKKSE
jgi:hypothetical protein